MTNVTCELVWLLSLLRDFSIEHKKPTILYCDNEVSLQIATNLVFHERTKHIEIDCHFFREKLQAGCLKTLHVSSQNQIANFLTKPLFSNQSSFFSSQDWNSQYSFSILRENIKVA